MKTSSYLLRIDDVCPGMNWDIFYPIIDMVLSLGISPILGVIPDNKDIKLEVHPTKQDFWEHIKDFQKRGAIIAQHGYQHIYTTKNAGVLNINSYSEFAGLPYEKQLQKISNGRKILEKNLGSRVTWWMAPAHSFDKNTCRALRNEGFSHITDGFALFPFQKYGLTWIPQQLWRPVSMPFGTWTICIHPNTLSPRDVYTLTQFIKTHKNQFRNVSLKIKYEHTQPLFQGLWNIALRMKRK